MRPAILHLDIYQDDDFVKALQFTDVDGAATDITAWTLKAEIRNTPGGAVVVETFTITKTDAANGEIELSLTDAETLAVAAGSYAWDLERVLGAATRTLLAGKVTVRADVTR